MKKLIFLLLCMIFTGYSYGQASVVKADSLGLTISDSIKVQDTLNLKNLYREIVKDSIKFPDIVMRQAIVESGWLKSNYCIKRHNIFGFRNKSGYMYFDTWQECVLYYKKWQDKHYKSGSYYQFLINIGYAQNGKEYIEYLKKVKIPAYVYE